MSDNTEYVSVEEAADIRTRRIVALNSLLKTVASTDGICEKLRDHLVEMTVKCLEYTLKPMLER